MLLNLVRNSKVDGSGKEMLYLLQSIYFFQKRKKALCSFKKSIDGLGGDLFLSLTICFSIRSIKVNAMLNNWLMTLVKNCFISFSIWRYSR